MVTRQPISAASSGTSPNNATPKRTPALNGTTARARCRSPVSHTPSTAPSSPTKVARAGAAMPMISLYCNSDFRRSGIPATAVSLPAGSRPGNVFGERQPGSRARGASCGLKLEQFPQPPRLYPADRNFGVLFVVHAELIARFEPGHDFFDAVDIDQVGTMHTPEHLAIQICLEILDGAVEIGRA